jgi:hypothetical protein
MLLESRKHEIETEIKQRVSKATSDSFGLNLLSIILQVEAAKQEMERELMKELEKMREQKLNEEKRREVCIGLKCSLDLKSYHLSLILFTLPNQKE